MKLKLARPAFAATFGGGLGVALAYATLQLVVNEGFPGLDRLHDEWTEYRKYRASKQDRAA